jgi:tripeptidyl-peptidase-2
VTVAIFDTGVDPGAPGLQVTTDGKSKIVDIIDGSGSGDVDTSTVVEAADGTLKGLSGRALKLGDWTNPTGKYHVGLKAAYELFPGGLVGRLKTERAKDWDAAQRALLTELKRQLVAWDAEHAKPTREQKKERDELVRRIDLLKEMQNSYDDPGPIFDCVVFHDGEVWRAAVDTDADGDLAEEKVLANFRLEREYATFGDEDLMNFALNVYEDGNVLSIVADVGAHGTHVAGIVAAHFPDQPELNGIAPGAQLVAVKIGDTRFGSSSLGTGEIRGCVAVIQNNCDLINMSYGGPTPDPNKGRTAAIYTDIVRKHNVIFCSSAGNSGPALTTAGAPGATTDAIFGIGAYISPAMQEVQYSLRRITAPTRYTFTSRGPTADGALGAAFAAPGGAIAPVPNWVLQRNMQMHGTSMASPNACGNIALLLSGMKAEGIPITPIRVRRALENTATPVPGTAVLALGRGLIQIDQAFEYLQRDRDLPDQDVRYQVTIPADDARGIYLREPYETRHVVDARVIVDPVFHEDADNRLKVEFETRVNLEATVPWIECAEHMLLMHGGRRLDVRVDPTRLPEGVHYAEIRGYDADRLERGPLFRVPVTVVRPQTVVQTPEPVWREMMTFSPAEEERRFLAVPDGATWADLRLKRVDDNEEACVLVTQLVQLLPGESFADNEFKQYLRIASGTEQVFSLPVVGGRTLELALAQYTSYLGEGEVEVTLDFHGLVPERDEVLLDGGALATSLEVAAPLRKERLSPSGSLATLQRTLRPTAAKLRPLSGERDRLPEERQVYELVLDYELELKDGATITPRGALSLTGEWNESYQSQIGMVFDSAKRLVDFFSGGDDGIKLDKGKYVLRFHVRRDEVETLEPLKDMPLLVEIKLDKPVGLQFAADPDEVLEGGRFGSQVLARDARARVWIATPDADDLPDEAKPGDELIGSLTLGDANERQEGEGHRPGGYRVVMTVPPKPEDTDKVDVAEDEEEEKSAEVELAEALRDFKVKQLEKLRGEEDRALFDKLASEILAEYPNHLPVLLEKLKRADGEDREEHLPEVVAAADAIIAEIDQEALAAHYGRKLDEDDKDAKKVRKEMDEKKAALVEALHRKAKALFDMSGAEAGRPVTDAAADERKAFEAAFAELEKWVDTTDEAYLDLHIDRAIARGELGEALKLVNGKIADNPPSKDLCEQRIEILEALGWQSWAGYEREWLLLRFPVEYPLF